MRHHAHALPVHDADADVVAILASRHLDNRALQVVPLLGGEIVVVDIGQREEAIDLLDALGQALLGDAGDRGVGLLVPAVGACQQALARPWARLLAQVVPLVRQFDLLRSAGGVEELHLGGRLVVDVTAMGEQRQADGPLAALEAEELPHHRIRLGILRIVQQLEDGLGGRIRMRLAEDLLLLGVLRQGIADGDRRIPVGCGYREVEGLVQQGILGDRVVGGGRHLLQELGRQAPLLVRLGLGVIVLVELADRADRRLKRIGGGDGRQLPGGRLGRARCGEQGLPLGLLVRLDLLHLLLLRLEAELLRRDRDLGADEALGHLEVAHRDLLEVPGVVLGIGIGALQVVRGLGLGDVLGGDGIGGSEGLGDAAVVRLQRHEGLDVVDRHALLAPEDIGLEIAYPVDVPGRLVVFDRLGEGYRSGDRAAGDVVGFLHRDPPGCDQLLRHLLADGGRGMRCRRHGGGGDRRLLHRWDRWRRNRRCDGPACRSLWCCRLGGCRRRAHRHRDALDGWCGCCRLMLIASRGLVVLLRIALARGRGGTACAPALSVIVREIGPGPQAPADHHQYPDRQGSVLAQHIRHARLRLGWGRKALERVDHRGGCRAAGPRSWAGRCLRAAEVELGRYDEGHLALIAGALPPCRHVRRTQERAARGTGELHEVGHGVGPGWQRSGRATCRIPADFGYKDAARRGKQCMRLL